MKKILLFLFVAVFLMSCGSSKRATSSSTKKRKPRTYKPKNVPLPKYNNDPTLADKVVWTAVTYKGIPYKYGGTTKRGMDCSGLVYTSFKKRNIFMPRTSSEMYNKGYSIKLSEAKRGDLLFFRTSKTRNRVNHVGLVTSAKNGNVTFIHSTSSRGVIVTTLPNSKYWRNAFVGAKRVL